MDTPRHLARRQAWFAALLGTGAAAAVFAARLARRAQLVEHLDPLDSVPFSGTVAFPTALAEAAASRLFDWLGALAWIVFAIGAVTVAATWAGAAVRLRPEIRVRRAVGASRRVLIRALAADAVLSATLAVAAGLILGTLAASAAGRIWPAGHWPVGPILVIAGTSVGALVIGVVFPVAQLRGRRFTDQDAVPPPLGIGAAQIGLALAFLVGGAMLRDHARPEHAGAIRVPGNAEIQRVRLAGATSAARAAELQAILAGAGGAGLVSITGAGGHLGVGPVDELMTDCGQCYVGGIFLRWRPLRAGYLTATADTFAARGFTVLAGRTITDDDTPEAEPVAVVNHHLGRRYFQGGDPVGRSVYLGGRLGGRPYRVVGMVEDSGPVGLAGVGRPRETVYLSSLQHPSAAMEVLTTNPPATSISASGPPVLASTFLRRSQAPLDWFAAWFLGLGAVGLGLGVAGTTVLMSSWTRAMAGELAVRRAVGATRWSVARLVAAAGARTGATGAAIGIVFVGPVVWPELARLAPGMSVWRPGLIGGVAALLIVLSIGAALGPALAAGRQSPAQGWRD